MSLSSSFLSNTHTHEVCLEEICSHHWFWCYIFRHVRDYMKREREKKKARIIRFLGAIIIIVIALGKCIPLITLKLLADVVSPSSRCQYSMERENNLCRCCRCRRWSLEKFGLYVLVIIFVNGSILFFWCLALWDGGRMNTIIVVDIYRLMSLIKLMIFIEVFITMFVHMLKNTHFDTVGK